MLAEDVLWGVGAAPGRAAKHFGNLENFLLEREILHLDLMLQLRGAGRGATLSDLQTFATRHQVCSPRRVSLFLNQLIGLERLRQVPSGEDGRVRRLIPGEALIAYQIGCHERTAHLIRIINPESSLLQMLEQQPKLRDEYMLRVGELFHAGVAAPLQVANLFRLISYDAGMAILYSILHACLIAHDEVRAGEPFRFHHAKTAEGFGISRSHIRNFIDKAAKLKLLAVEEHDRTKIVLSDVILNEWSELVGFLMIRGDEAVRMLNDAKLVGLGDVV